MTSKQSCNVLFYIVFLFWAQSTKFLTNQLDGFVDNNWIVNNIVFCEPIPQNCVFGFRFSQYVVSKAQYIFYFLQWKLILYFYKNWNKIKASVVADKLNNTCHLVGFPANKYDIQTNIIASVWSISSDINLSLKGWIKYLSSANDKPSIIVRKQPQAI